MSNKDYRKYHQPDKPEPRPNTKPDFRAMEELSNPTADERVDQETTPVEEANKTSDGVDRIGVVTECTRLNVRKLPNQKAEVLIILDFATEVMVKEYNKNPDWVKVLTKTGVEGYCMKKFINTK